MSDNHPLEKRLNQLGRDMASLPSLVPPVMARIISDSLRPRSPRRRVTRARAIIALAAAACLVTAAILSLSRPSTLYARALKALSQARTVHVTGWTTRIVRKWPLEPSKQDGQAQQQQKYPFEAWYWRKKDGTPRSYEKFGPVIQTRDGATLREYQQDVDLLFVSEGSHKDYLEMFATVAEYLRALDGESVKKQELGTRTDRGRTLRGLKVVRHNRTEEYWFDVETDLPVRFSRSQQDNGGTASGFEMHFSYDDQVPMAIARYVPPETENIRYGGHHENVQLAWRRHVQQIGLDLQEQPLDGPVAILPRVGQETFAVQWRLATPDGKHWVVPLDLDQYFPLTVKNFINLQVATDDGDRAYETWRVSKDLLEVELPRADVVYAEGTPWQQWVQYVLNQNGIEYVDIVEERTFWIARHDGRKLKTWRAVQPPVPYIVEGGVVKKGVVRPGIGHQLVPETMHGLFEDFNRLQNINFTADHPIIVDQTELPQPPDWDRAVYPTYDEYRQQVLDEYLVATDSPWFAGQESRQMARDWFRKEFGVTFTEEQRPLTIHVVRRKITSG